MVDLSESVLEEFVVSDFSIGGREYICIFKMGCEKLRIKVHLGMMK